ncbi:MAG: outer membrane beta-barrel protein [Candidatus Krumholzibacteria bacterium]|nr:outer membrane beta-barrel protein [Candidatus Krumholzibacteria bacterium]
MNLKKRIILLAALLLATALVTPASAGRPHVREGWQIGLSYGYGAGRVTLSDAFGSYKGVGEGGATPQWRIGRMIGRQFALGLEYNGWMLEGGTAERKIRSSLQQVMVTGTWYPGHQESASGGLYLRGGMGLGWGGIADVEIIDQIQEHGDRLDESGLGLMASIGYEFRITTDVAAGLGAGINYLSINKDFYESGWFTPFTGTLTWYWD